MFELIIGIYIALCLFLFFYPMWKYRYRETSEYKGSDRYMSMEFLKLPEVDDVDE